MDQGRFRDWARGQAQTRGWGLYLQSDGRGAQVPGQEIRLAPQDGQHHGARGPQNLKEEQQVTPFQQRPQLIKIEHLYLIINQRLTTLRHIIPIPQQLVLQMLRVHASKSINLHLPIVLRLPHHRTINIPLFPYNNQLYLHVVNPLCDIFAVCDVHQLLYICLVTGVELVDRAGEYCFELWYDIFL